MSLGLVLVNMIKFSKAIYYNVLLIDNAHVILLIYDIIFGLKKKRRSTVSIFL